MPYDPRPVSEGGNRGIDEEFSRKAPKGKFRVISVDTFDGTDGVVGDYDSFPVAHDHAKKHSGQMERSYVYDDQGHCLDENGTF